MEIVATGLLEVAFSTSVAAGLFVGSAALSALTGKGHGVRFVPAVATMQGWRRRLAIAAESVLLLVGALQVVAGVYGVFTIVI